MDSTKKIKRLYAIMSVGLVLILTALYFASMAPSVKIENIDYIEPIGKNDRVMVFAPHCDDEVLGASGLIQKALLVNAPVKVVLVTNGDDNFFSTNIEFKTVYPDAKTYIESGEMRQRETLDAMKLIGVDSDDVIFLGYPDKGIDALYTTNWPDHNPFKSGGTEVTHAPYDLIYEKNALYSGENLLKNIKQVIAEFSPTVIVLPHLADKHTDHQFSAMFILMAAKEIDPEKRPLLLTYLIHYPYFPYPKGMLPEKCLLPPFAATFERNWYKLMLTEGEMDKKRIAIKKYETQIVTPELGRLMRSFNRQNELFEEVTPEDVDFSTR